MNIKQAKNYIKQTVQLYLKKDEFDAYRIPVVRQRPVFLLGAPGLGKTAIMEQIASELGIALVSYSMTHHTRQSALGLPYIAHKSYEGMEFDVSEYTMSEIISSIYETMEKSGRKEGILFLDEINCVSETLSPSMLQFLQMKVFGRHSVPDGWVVVTAGNPPEYNRSVREFDVVTMDRLKVLEVEPDYPAWKEYAQEKGLHSVILSFLELKKEYFYRIETTVSGRSYVTARGWEDLSQILMLYEEEGLTVDETLIGQYLRNEKIVREFGAYYDLYNKYKRDYAIEEILAGNPSEFALQKAEKAGFDERLSLLSMLMDRVRSEMTYVMDMTDYFTDLVPMLKKCKETSEDGDILGYLASREETHRELMNSLKSANAMSMAEQKKQQRIIQFLLETQRLILSTNVSGMEAFDQIKEKYEAEVQVVRARTQKAQQMLKALFEFVDKAFSSGNEMLILVTDLTANANTSGFIGRFGSEEYQKFSEELMVTKAADDIEARLQEIEL